MSSRGPNFWLLTAGWWLMMIVVGAIFTIPVFEWDAVVSACKILAVPAALMAASGLLFKDPNRYLAWLAFIGALWIMPATLVCLTPLCSFIFLMRHFFSTSYYVLLVVSLTALPIFFLLMRIDRERRKGSMPADSHIFLEDGIAYVRFSDLQGKHTSIGDSKFDFLAPPVMGLAVFGYPIQKLLAMTTGYAGISFIGAILLTPVASWLMAWMMRKFAFWALPIWRYERTYGRPVFLRLPDKVG